MVREAQARQVRSAIWPLAIAHDERRDPLDFLPDLPDPTGEGARAWEIFGRFKLTEGESAGTYLEDHYAPWQRRLIEIVYGYVDEDGRRIFQEIMLLVARKSGKSALSSIWALAHQMLYPEERGQLVLMSDTQKTAGILYRNLVALINADGYLKRRFKIREHVSEIIDRETGTRTFAISSELSNIIGLGPSAFVCDELHLIGSRPKGEQLVRGLTTGQLARTDPLAIYITTQSMGTPSGIFASMLARARRVQAGRAPEDSRFLPVLFEPPQDARPADRHYWHMANPSAGITFPMERLNREYEVAIADPDPTKLAIFASQHLNIPGSSGGLGYDKWIPGDIIGALEDPDLTLERIAGQSDLFWLTLDRGGSEDMEALCIVGTRDVAEHERHFLYWGHQYITVRGYEKHKKYLPLDEFIAAGELTVVESAADDLVRVQEILDRLESSGMIGGFGFDMHNAGEMTELCQRRGLFGYQVPQGWKLMGGMVWLERTILDRRWSFAPNRLLRWNLDHAVVKWTGNSKTLNKEMSQSKIDGAVAWAMAGYLIGQRVNVESWGHSRLGNIVTL